MMFLQNAASLARKELSGAFSLVETPCSPQTWRESARISHLSYSFFIDRSFIRFSLFLAFSCFIDKKEKGTSTYDAKSRNRISRISSDVRTITEWKNRREEKPKRISRSGSRKRENQTKGRIEKRWKRRVGDARLLFSKLIRDSGGSNGRLREGGFARDDCVTGMVLNPTSSQSMSGIYWICGFFLKNSRNQPSNIKTN